MADRSLAELIPRGVGLGCWQFGDMGRGTPADETSVALIREAYRKGIRHFDTAHDYGMGHSEEVLGRGIEPFSEKAFVSTKMHAASREETIAGVEKSLSRLKREWIDLFSVHWPRTGFDLRPMMEALELLRTQGKIRLIGVSNFSVKDMAQASEAGRIDAHQLCYNLLWRYPEGDVIPYCRQKRIELITYSSLAQGLLTGTIGPEPRFAQGDPRPATVYYQSDVWPHVWEGLQELLAIASETGRPLAHLALRWITDSGRIRAVLVGSRSASHLAQNLAALDGEIAPSLMGRLDEVSAKIQRHIPPVGNIFKYYP